MEKFLHGNTIHASLKKVLISQNLASKRLTIYTKSCTLKILHTANSGAKTDSYTASLAEKFCLLFRDGSSKKLHNLFLQSTYEMDIQF